MRLCTLSWLLSFYIDLWCSARLLTDYLAFGLFDSISLLPSRRWYYWWILLAMAIGSWGCRESPVIAIRDKPASVAFLWPPWCGVDEMWMTVLSLPKTTGQSISIYENVMINYWMELFTKSLNTWFMRRDFLTPAPEWNLHGDKTFWMTMIIRYGMARYWYCWQI